MKTFEKIGVVIEGVGRDAEGVSVVSQPAHDGEEQRGMPRPHRQAAAPEQLAAVGLTGESGQFRAMVVDGGAKELALV